MILLALGGARSGKTAHALAWAEAQADARLYIATAEAWDDEMAERIARHKAERGAGWRTAEAPLDIAGALAGARPGEAVTVDCLTLWLSNLMHHGRDPEAETTRLLAAVAAAPGPVALVSNEVGLGIVPENRLARRFRDAQGRLNQAVARAADRVVFMVAGLPMAVKGGDGR